MFFKVLSLLSIAITLAQHAVAQSGNYSYTCTQCWVSDSTSYNAFVTLNCLCEPGPILTFIDLNNCFNNDNGSLVFQHSGNFTSTCNKVWGIVEDEGKTSNVFQNAIGAMCNNGSVIPDTDGDLITGENPTQANLDDYIGNYNGGLVC